MMQAIEERIKQMIVENLELGAKAANVKEDTPLLEGGLNLDSVAVLELISLVEEEFGVHVKDEDVSMELLGSVGGLARYVREHAGKSGSTEAKATRS
jgi:acyl carrier protein